MSRDLAGNAGDARFDAQQRLTKVVGEFDLPEGDDHDASVVSFIDQHAEELSLPDEGDLRVVDRAETQSGTVVRLQQHVDGVPVFGSEIVVASDPESRVRSVDAQNASVDLTVSSSVADSGGKKLTAKEVARKALDSLGAGVTVRGEAPKPTTVYLPTDAGLKLAYVVLIPTRNPAHDWRLIIDAHTGEVLEKKDLIVFVNGSGLVFDPNPVVTSGNVVLRDPDATVVACGFAGTPRATIDAQRVTRPLLDITLGGDGLHRLEGPYAKMQDFGVPASVFPAEADPTAFRYSSGDERFEAVEAYWAVDTLQRYLQSIGIITAHNSQISIDPHDSEDGPAWFSSIDQALHFSASGGCRPDRAEDAECIMHEYGHAIQNNQVPTWGGANPTTGRAETGAMGEGFGDALACIFTASKSGGFGRAVFEDWVFGDIGGLRRVDGTKVYPGDWTSEVHNDGEIWSAALWNIYRALGGDSASLSDQEVARQAVLKSVINSHHRLAGNATMPDGAEAVMVENAALPEYRGKHLKEMLNSFHARGLLPCSSSTDLYIHDVATDGGAESTAGQAFWDSPDLWIRNADDNGSSHQPPEFGQDNWFYARVTNRGTAIARAFVVTFNVKLWAGTEFVYPADWDPFISAACGFNLAPGASRVVKARWPSGLVPAAGSHACWLASVYTPVESSPAGRHTWESNNLAQKNLTVVDLVANDRITIGFEIGSLNRLETEQIHFEVLRPPKFEELEVAITSTQPGLVERLFRSTEAVRGPKEAVVQPQSPISAIRFPQPSEIEIASGGAAPVRLRLGPESSVALTRLAVTKRIAATNGQLVSRDADLVRPSNLNELTAESIVFRPGAIAGFPVLVRAREPIAVGVTIAAPKGAQPGDSFDVDLVQRNTDGDIIGGIRVRATIVD